MKKIFYSALVFFCLFVFTSAYAKGFSTIRDDEIEIYLQDISRPLFEAANLDADNIKLFLVNDRTLNAFVAGGQNMFVHTGLILEDSDPSLLIGVMAHETGHLVGGHLVRKVADAKKASAEAAIGYILGIAATAISGSSEAGMAIIGGGQQIAQSQYLKHSRIHEESADEVALKLLAAAEISPKGLLGLLKKLGAQTAMDHGDEIDPYRLTHPLSPQRISRIIASLEETPENNYPILDKLQKRHTRILAKLRAFIEKPEKTIELNQDKIDLSSRYALAIARYRALEINPAIEIIDQLIGEFPQDPYFYELKGQILFENARIDESITAYRKAMELLPESALIQTSLAGSLLAADDNPSNLEAINYLEKAAFKESKNPAILHQLGIAYGREGKLGLSYLALAEEAYLFGKKEESEQFIKRASKYIDFDKDTPTALKAGDLMKSLHLTK